MFLLSSCNTDEKKDNQEAKKEETNTKKAASDFRNVSWNMSSEDVKKNEDAHLVEQTADYIVYDNVSMFNTPFSLMYMFKDNKLMGAKYIAELNPATGDVENLFNSFKQTLSQKYGEPIHDAVNWSGMMKQLPPEKRNINNGLLLGNVDLLTMWSGDTSANPSRSVRLECSKLQKTVLLINTNIDIEFQKELNRKQKEYIKNNI